MLHICKVIDVEQKIKAMQYNLIKKMKHAKSFEFILRGVSIIEATQNLDTIYETELTRMFSDIDVSDNKFTVTTASGEVITYEIEEDRNFSAMAMVSKGYEFSMN